MQDPEFQRLYCEWAGGKWPELAPVDEVRFDIGTHGPYSEWTPDVDAYVAIEVKHAGKWHEREVEGLPDLLGELLRFDRVPAASK